MSGELGTEELNPLGSVKGCEPEPKEPMAELAFEFCVLVLLELAEPAAPLNEFEAWVICMILSKGK